MNETIIQMLQEIANDMCDNYCKYQNTTDEDGLCDCVRNGGKCPLDMIN